MMLYSGSPEGSRIFVVLNVFLKFAGMPVVLTTIIVSFKLESFNKSTLRNS